MATPTVAFGQAEATSDRLGQPVGALGVSLEPSTVLSAQGRFILGSRCGFR
jgi:hypothetical protein